MSFEWERNPHLLSSRDSIRQLYLYGEAGPGLDYVIFRIPFSPVLRICIVSLLFTVLENRTQMLMKEEDTLQPSHAVDLCTS